MSDRKITRTSLHFGWVNGERVVSTGISLKNNPVSLRNGKVPVTHQQLPDLLEGHEGQDLEAARSCGCLVADMADINVVTGITVVHNGE